MAGKAGRVGGVARGVTDGQENVIEMGRDLGWHRVWIARHYPTDIYAGRVLAQALVREMESNRAFRRDLDQARREIDAVRLGMESTDHPAPPNARAAPATMVSNHPTPPR